MSLTSVTSGRRDSPNDAHHCKMIHARDRPMEPLRLMWLRGLMVWSGKTHESQRNKFVFRSVSHGSVHAIIKDHLQFRRTLLAMDSASNAGGTNDWQNGCMWIIYSGTTGKSMRLCRVSSQGTKRGATILSPRANGKANNGNTSISGDSFFRYVGWSCR